MKTNGSARGPAGTCGLSRKTKLGFGVCDLGGNLFFTVLGFYLLYFLTDRAGLGAGLAGTALMIGKGWDAVSDPLVGVLSDRTKTRWGRRRPWMFAGALLLFVFMPLMFFVPPIRSQAGLFLWAAAVYCLLNTAYTFVSIPYGALTPELTADYHERSVLNGYRMTFAVLGTFLGAAAMLPLVGLFADPASGWFAAAAVFGTVMTSTALVTVFTVREPSSSGSTAPAGLLASYRAALANKPFLLVLAPWALHITAVTVIQGSLVFYFEYLYGDKGAFLPALVLLLACAMACIGPWIRVSRRIGKKNTYNLGMGIFAAALLVFFFAGPRFGLSFAYGIMAAAGVGFSVQYAMPFAILPDVVEYDYSVSGVRREGVYYGLWTFASKTGQAFASVLSGWVLAFAGFHPPGSQPESALFGIRLLVGVVPAAFCLAGIAVHVFYPIDRAFYEKMTAGRPREEEPS